MAVSLTEGWKVPVGYFLIAGLQGDEKANLVQLCLWRCLSHGVVAGGYLFTECVDSAAVQMRRRHWLGGLLALAQAGCQASLRGNASLCVKQERKAEAG